MAIIIPRSGGGGGGGDFLLFIDAILPNQRYGQISTTLIEELGLIDAVYDYGVTIT